MTFNPPLVGYVDNFIGVKTGAKVPLGSYDRELGQWVPETDGRVILLVGVDGNGAAQIDIDGTGVVTDLNAAAAALGTTQPLLVEELHQLKALYAPGPFPFGRSLWRLNIPHCSSYDPNFPPSPPCTDEQCLPPDPDGSGPPGGGGDGAGAGATGTGAGATGPGATGATGATGTGATGATGTTGTGAGTATGTGAGVGAGAGEGGGDPDAAGGTGGPGGGPTPGGGGPNDPCKDAGGSIAECENQTLHESIPVAGTPYSLHYASDRVRGRTALSAWKITLRNGAAPFSLKRIELDVQIAGQQFHQDFSPGGVSTFPFVWDGKDGLGRDVQGRQLATATVSYVYPFDYGSPPTDSPKTFGAPAQAGVIAAKGRDLTEGKFSRSSTRPLGAFRTSELGIGGWDLDVHHVYDPATQILYLGNGDRQSVEDLPLTLRTLGAHAGVAFAAAPAGRFANYIPGGSTLNFYGADGVESSQVSLPDATKAVSIGPSGEVWAIVNSGGPGGTKLYRDTTLIAGATTGDTSSGDPAAADLTGASDLAVGPDGSVFIAQGGRIRRVAPGATYMDIVAGTGTPQATSSPDGAFARGAPLDSLSALTVGKDGSVFFAEGTVDVRIRRIDAGGLLQTLVGGGSTLLANIVEGAAGRSVHLTSPFLNGQLATDGQGTVFFSDSSRCRVLRASPDGGVTTVAGTICPSAQQPQTTLAALDGAPSRRALLGQPAGLAFGNGKLYFLDSETNQQTITTRVDSPFSASGERGIASADGTLIYKFLASGRHTDTVDAFTGATLLHFDYGPDNHLVAAHDVAGRVTTVTVTSPTNVEVRSPDQLATEVGIDSTTGYATSIANPAGETQTLQYLPNGLLTARIDARGETYLHEFDSLGRLTSEQDPATKPFGKAFRTYARTENGSAWTVTQTSAEGRSRATTIETFGDGSRRRTIKDLGSGLATVEMRSSTGDLRTTFPDGTVATTTRSADPRFGLLSPLESTSETLPTGASVAAQTLVTTASRTVVAGTDPLVASSITDTRTIGGATWTKTWDRASSTRTRTSPVGRRTVETLDAAGRVVNIHTPNTANAHVPPQTDTGTQFELATGRLLAISRGARATAFGYDPHGHLAMITDALNQSTSFQNDLIGRPLQTVAADGTLTQQLFDKNGSLEVLTNGNGNVYELHHDGVNLLSSFIPPDVPSDQLRRTAYDYDLDRNATHVLRPDGVDVHLSYDSSGRLNQIGLPGGPLTYNYDPTTGQLDQVTMPDLEKVSFTWNGRLPLKTSWSGAVSGSVERTYDARWRLATEKVKRCERGRLRVRRRQSCDRRRVTLDGS